MAPHHLVGTAEIAQMLGVTRQRVDRIASTHSDFPAPEAELSAGRIWSREAVESWMARHPERKPGREGGFIMFERFTDRARRSIILAQQEARSLGHSYLGCEHLVLGLLREGTGVAGRSLAAHGVTPERAVETLMAIIGPGAAAADGLPRPQPFTPRAKYALELTNEIALELGHNYVGTEHVLLGILREGDNVGCRVLIDLNVDPYALRLHVFEMMGFPQPQRAPDEAPSPDDSLGDAIMKRLDQIDARLGSLEARLP